MTGDGGLVEVQATAERTPVSRASFDELLGLAEPAIAKLREAQAAACGGPLTGPRAGLMAARRGWSWRPATTTSFGSLREILPGFELVPLPPEIELPPETGTTFEENALIKARAARAATGAAAIADDSGIAAAALGGRPGVHSARFAGPDATDKENLDLLLASSPRQDDRRVAYVCVIAHVDDGRRRAALRGPLRGHLDRHPARERRLRLRPGVRSRRDRPRGRADDVRALARREAPDQPPRPRRAGARRRARRRVGRRRVIRTKSGAAGLSVASNSLLIALKLAAGAITGSIAIITEAIHSAIDLLASIVALSQRPRAPTSRPIASTPTATRRSRTWPRRSRAC